ncbi:hypothetical protein VPNG_02979 [Cytospora leucostoma]|uniref:DNA2/NAM7 helicase-like C-terminal domain-containing protein n=1 Tax=Cytospora leucostoma TaxID=1230097 RepID=A0A423XGM5_9PEZI|nr:hypothetical protein VPNG_02979 [Cytospora leucostoma]
MTLVGQSLRTSLRQVITWLFSEAKVVCATSYGALEKHTSHFTKTVADILTVDEAGAITEAEVLSCMFHPAKLAFHKADNIEDVFHASIDTTLARRVENWTQTWGRGTAVPPKPKHWPIFLNITGTRIAIIIPYWAMLMRAQQGLRARGINIYIGLPDDSRLEHEDAMLDNSDDEGHDSMTSQMPATGTPVTQSTAGSRAPALPSARAVLERRDPRGLDIGTVDAYQGSEKDMVFVFTTVSASSGPKFMAKSERKCVAMTRHIQGCVVVGDMDFLHE